MIAFRDGDLAADEVSSVAAHLKVCEECELVFHRLRYAVGNRAELAPDPVLLSRMQSAIQQWEMAALRNGCTGDIVKRKVAAAIEPFLGPEATSSILNSVADSGENLLSSVESVLASFLGSQAAALLVNQVVDSALLRA